MFLRDDLKPSMFYGGATAYAECYQYIKLMNKYKSRMLRPAGENDAYAASENNAKARLALQNNIIKETSSRTLKVGNDTSTDGNNGGAVAKPLGALPNGAPPTDAIIVLPLFSDVSLIPSSMQSCRPLRVNFSYLEIFLIWLSSVEDLNNPETSPPAGTQQYLTALQNLDDPTFRKTGWNHAYTHSNGDPITYFSNDYKYNSISNPGGAGWLQQIWVSVDANRDEDASTEIEEQAAGWNTRIYSGKYYMLKDGNGNLVTNEQMQCRWEPRGPGSGGPGPGTRIGPTHL